MLSQIVADRLGCRIEDVVVTAGDTNAISQGVGAFASRQAINAGNSASIAAGDVRAQVIALAARTIGVPETEIDVDEGRAIARGGNKPILTFGELARLAQGMPGFSLSPGQRPGLEHTAYFTPPQASYCNGTHVAQVEVDPMTGGVTILNYMVAHDSGSLINPMIVDGQVQGGIAQGIGTALYEEIPYDELAQPLATTFADYMVPCAPEIPMVRIEHIVTPALTTEYGVKGLGEGGAIAPPAAIANAIADAFRDIGASFNETPLTPRRVSEAIASAQAKASAS
jgi:carbon-monoxide dehydrogenase large subunit